MANKTRGYPSGAAGEHNNFFTFDANGNILTQQRYEGSTLVDNLTYQYATNSAGDLLSNRLYSVDDAVTVASLSATDMEDMPLYNNTSPNTSNNYKYTQIGELKSDNQEEISEIHWRVDSKISQIVRTSGSSKKNLKFEYDAMGNRVAKHVYAGSVLESSTYYVRDAQGNVMGVYEHKMDAENAVMEYKLIERNIYGSAQVGICKDTVDLNITNASGSLTQATYYHARQLNHRQYSLSNHLGNVLTTIGDGKAPVDSNSDGVIDYFAAYIISVSDYSPFGVELASRTWSIEEYRNGFNGKEKVTEITGNSSDYDFGARIYDARIGRWKSVDAKAGKYPSISPYAFCLNNPIVFKDPDGNDVVLFDQKGNKVATITKAGTVIEKGMENSAILKSYVATKEYFKGTSGEADFTDFENASKILNIKATAIPEGAANFQNSGYKDVKGKDNNGNKTLDDGDEVTSADYSSSTEFGTIEWNPLTGGIDAEGNRHSPAMIFIHELKHAKHFKDNLIKYIQDGITEKKGMGNGEEENAINETNTISGEKGNGDGGNGADKKRTTHEAKGLFKAKSTTSNQAAPAPVKKKK